MNKKQIGFILVLLFVVITISNVTINGAAIGTPVSNSLSLISVVFFVVGLTLMLQRERNYAREILDQRRYVYDTRELRSVAKRMGYTLVDGFKEGTRVYNGNQVLTVIPHHRHIQGRGTVKSILEALATGESSFRRHQH